MSLALTPVNATGTLCGKLSGPTVPMVFLLMTGEVALSSRRTVPASASAQRPPESVLWSLSKRPVPNKLCGISCLSRPEVVLLPSSLLLFEALMAPSAFTVLTPSL